MKRVRNISRKIVFALSSLLIIAATFVLSVKAANNSVYFNNTTVYSNESGLIIAELIVEGNQYEEVKVKYHTSGVSAIENVDYVGVSNTLTFKIDESGYISYKIAIKCLNTPENRSKYLVAGSNNEYFSRYFNLVIDDVSNATLVEKKSVCKCYTPYSHVVSGNTKKFDSDGIDVSYLSDLNDMEYQFTDGSKSIEKGRPWKSWQAGVSFINERTQRWVNAFINEGIASAYTSFVIRDLDDSEFFSKDKIYTYVGNREMIEKFTDDKNNNPGMYMFLSTEPCSNKSSGFLGLGSERRGYRIELSTMDAIANMIYSGGDNPYKIDDDWVDLKDYRINTTSKKVYWFNRSGTWYADDGAFINTTFYKIQPYNGVLDVGLAVRNNDGDQDRMANRIWMFLKLIDDKVPQIIGEYADPSEIISTGKLKLYVRFNEPVFASQWNTSKGSALEVKFNNGSSAKYATYVGGNYTDTLVYELDVSDIPKANITKISYQLPNNDIGDMAINRDSKKNIINNKLSLEFTNTTRTMTILDGSINLLSPTLTADITSSSNPKNNYNIIVSMNDNGEKDLNEGTLYYEWSKESSKSNYYDSFNYEKSHVFTSEEGGSFNILLVENETEGITGGLYYLHVLAETKYGGKDAATFGPYYLDGSPPEVTLEEPVINSLQLKEYNLVVKNGENTFDADVKTITLVAKHLDSEGNMVEDKLIFYQDGAFLDKYRYLTKMTEDYENNQTIYTYMSSINVDAVDESDNSIYDEFLAEVMGDNPRMDFDISFIVEDTAGNKAKTNSLKVAYDKRDLFKVSCYVPLIDEIETDGYRLIDDINVSYGAYDYSKAVNNRGIVISILDETEGGTQEGSDYRTLLSEGTKFSVLVNGIIYEADGDSGDLKYQVTISDLESGFHELIPMIKGESLGVKIDLVANSIKFYLTNNFIDETTNKQNSQGSLVLSNQVYQIPDVYFYYLNDTGSQILYHPYGATYNSDVSKYEGGSTNPTFSNINEAKKYIKYMEFQDLYLVKISSTIAALLNSDTNTTNYVKAAGETMNAQEGQLWIRYKKNSWNISSSAYSWAYYYYGNGKLENGINVSNLSANLNDAINEVVNRITNSGQTIYLVQDNNLDNQTYAPYLANSQIHLLEEEAISSKNGSTFAVSVKYEGDKNLYKNTVEVLGQKYPLATNMIFTYTDETRLFYKYAGVGDKWTPLEFEEDTILSELLDGKTSGYYLFREYDQFGISEYGLYFDKTLPELRVLNGDSEIVLDGTISQPFSNSSFTIKGIENEIDQYAYVAIYSYPNKKLLNVLYQKDIDVEGYTLNEGTYYIQVGDRSGNMITYTVLLSTSSLEVEAKMNESQTGMVVKVTDRDDSEITVYEVYLNEVLIDTEFGLTKVYRDPGIYRIVVSDIYGNTVTTIEEFETNSPEIVWYYLNDNDSYSKYDPERIVKMTVNDDPNSSRITNVNTSALLKLSFVTSYGDDKINFEVLDLGSADYSYQESNDMITLNKLVGFRLRVWFESYPENDHLYVVRVDTEAPRINATFVGTSFQKYVLRDDEDNIIETSSYDLIDLSNYQDGEFINLDSLAYEIGSTTKIDFYDGNVISGSHIILSLFDPSGIKGHTITRNGQAVSMDLNEDNQLIINSYGNYVVTTTDMLGNSTRISFVNTKDSLTKAYVDDLKITENKLVYGHNSVALEFLYEGENKILVKGLDSAYTYVFEYENGKVTYGRYVCRTEAYEDDDTGEIINQKKAQYEENAGFVFDVLNTNYKEGNWYQVITEENHLVLISLKDGKPVIKVMPVEEKIDVELLFSVGNNALPSYYLVSLSKEISEVNVLSGGEPTVAVPDSNYIYVADPISIDEDLSEIINKIEVGYSKLPTIEELKTIYIDGEFKQQFIGEEDGFYKIVVTNIFNNVKEYYLVKVESFESIVKVQYRDESTRTYSSNEGTIYSNSMILLDVYSDSVYFEVNGEKYAGIYNSGVTTLELYKTGEYFVKAISNNGLYEEFNFVIGSDYEFIYKEEWLSGYNQDALLYDQGYTNQKLDVIRSEDVLYIDYACEDGLPIILYDALSEEKILDAEALTQAIGNDGSGKYVIRYINKYGDVASKTIYYNDKPQLVLTRKIVGVDLFEPYDLDRVIEGEKFYSNYVLKFGTNSLKYEFTIDGNNVSLEADKTLEFTNSSGNGSFIYQITYLDEYGNYLEFEAELYRTDISIDSSLMNEIVINNNIYTKDNIVITFEDNLTGSVRVNGQEANEYVSGTKFYKDGTYEFIVQDIAGNRKKYSIVHKSVNQYTLVDNATGQVVIIGGVINNSSVLFDASDDSKITKVFKNGKQISDFNTNTFTTTGHWEILIEDSVGNVSYAGFYIINDDLAKFDYNAPFDYEISEVWFTDSHDQRRLLDMKGSQISLTENGNYAIVVVGKEQTSSFNFSVVIDNTPPKAILVGAEDGGITANDVSLNGLKKGDIVEIYKNGTLVSTTEISISSDSPTITTGGEYKIFITSVSGATTEYNFTRKQIANIATSVVVIISCIVAIAGISIGLIYHTRLKTDSKN